MNLKRWQVVTAFGLAIILMLIGVAWLSYAALRLDRRETIARKRAHQEENVRLALWRMDSALAALMASESARPYFHYRAFYAPDRSYETMFDESIEPSLEASQRIDALKRTGAQTGLASSPLLVSSPDHVLLHFHYAERDAAATSPSVPPASLRAQALKLVPEARVRAAEDALARFNRAITQASLVARLTSSQEVLPAPPGQAKNGPLKNSQTNNGQATAAVDAAAEPGRPHDEAREPENGYEQKKRYVRKVKQRVTRSAVELQKRQASFASQAQAVAKVLNNANVFERDVGPLGGTGGGATAGGATAGGEADAGMVPLWMDSSLLLVRQIQVGRHRYVQGCLLDWQEIRTWLLQDVSDLLPGAELVPARAPDFEGLRETRRAALGDLSSADSSAGSRAGSRADWGEALGETSSGETNDASERRLASLPLSLTVAPVDLASVGPSSSVIAILALAWTAVAVAIFAVTLLVLGIARLSARRADFVSSVTHELRTPLTTFRLYTDMLLEDMVKTKEKRQMYLATLQKEAVRLGHLVENVLAFARIERDRTKTDRVRIRVGQIVAESLERVRMRTEQAGMNVELTDVAGEDAYAWVDAGSVGQIVHNLVDNACKYGRSQQDAHIRVSVLAPSARWVVVRVQDGGRGVSSDVRRRLFVPFSKSAQRAASSAPGVGLGLALSRRLARDMGGDLVLDAEASPGACFLLYLPRVKGTWKAKIRQQR